MKAEWTSPLESFSLVAQAKEAYEQKRTRECMALTKALLLTDPTNSEALTLQAAIRTDMQRDMNDARALLEDSRHQEDPQKHRKAAEIILLKILYLDPENEQAKILLSATRAAEAHSGMHGANQSAAADRSYQLRSSRPSSLHPNRHAARHE